MKKARQNRKKKAGSSTHRKQVAPLTLSAEQIERFATVLSEITKSTLAVKANILFAQGVLTLSDAEALSNSGVLATLTQARAKLDEIESTVVQEINNHLAYHHQAEGKRYIEDIWACTKPITQLRFETYLHQLRFYAFFINYGLKECQGVGDSILTSLVATYSDCIDKVSQFTNINHDLTDCKETIFAIVKAFHQCYVLEQHSAIQTHQQHFGDVALYKHTMIYRALFPSQTWPKRDAYAKQGCASYQNRHQQQTLAAHSFNPTCTLDSKFTQKCVSLYMATDTIFSQQMKSNFDTEVTHFGALFDQTMHKRSEFLSYSKKLGKVGPNTKSPYRYHHLAGELLIKYSVSTGLARAFIKSLSHSTLKEVKSRSKQFLEVLADESSKLGEANTNLLKIHHLAESAEYGFNEGSADGNAFARECILPLLALLKQRWRPARSHAQLFIAKLLVRFHQLEMKTHREFVSENYVKELGRDIYELFYYLWPVAQYQDEQDTLQKKAAQQKQAEKAAKKERLKAEKAKTAAKQAKLKAEKAARAAKQEKLQAEKAERAEQHEKIKAQQDKQEKQEKQEKEIVISEVELQHTKTKPQLNAIEIDPQPKPTTPRRKSSSSPRTVRNHSPQRSTVEKVASKKLPLERLPKRCDIINHDVPPLHVFERQLMIHPAATRALQMLDKGGFVALIYGGAVRDHLRGKPFNDIDMITNAPLEKLQQIFGGFITTTYENCATVKCKIDGVEFEIHAAPEAGKRPVDLMANLLNRADFPINAAYCSLTHVYLHEKCAQALKQQRLNTFSTLKKDLRAKPQRILRAIYLKVARDIEYPPNFAPCVGRNDFYRKDNDKIATSIFNLFQSDHGEAVFAELLHLQQIRKLFPALSPVSSDQNPVILETFKQCRATENTPYLGKCLLLSCLLFPQLQEKISQLQSGDSPLNIHDAFNKAADDILQQQNKVTFLHRDLQRDIKIIWFKRYCQIQRAHFLFIGSASSENHKAMRTTFKQFCKIEKQLSEPSCDHASSKELTGNHG